MKFKIDPNNFIDFGYGYPQVINNISQFDNCIYYPFTGFSTRIPPIQNIWFAPPAIAPDEVFTYLSEYYVHNANYRYIISNYGRLYDTFCNRFVACRYNMKYFPNGETRGYYRAHVAYYIDPYTLSSVDIYIHRAAMMSFNYIPGCENLEVNHKDGIHLNNNIQNLEWVTSLGNIKHSIENKLKVKAEDNIGKTNIITIEDAENICKLYLDGYKMYQISDGLMIQQHTVFDVLSGTIMRDVTAKYGICNVTNIDIPANAIESICELISQAIPLSDIAAMTGINKYQLLQIRDRKMYVNISCHYDFRKAMAIDSYRRTLNDADVHEVCRRLQLGEGPSDVAEEMDIDINTVANIKNGKNYKEISSNYSFFRLNENVLSPDAVHAICLDMQNGMHNAEIGRKYDINKVTIGHIRRGETFTDISSQYNIPASDDLTPCRTLDDATVHAICKRLQNDESLVQIANDFGVNPTAINGIKNGGLYKDITCQYEFHRIAPSTISEEQVRIVCQGLQNRDKAGKILKDSGVSKRTLYRIRNKEKYTNISKDYTW